MTERQTSELARALLVVMVPAGVLLAVIAGPGVLLLGMAGLLMAWAYSAPPLQLMSRGLGELTVALVWFLVVVGADYVQRHQFFVIPASAAASFALMVAALLVINGVPDAPCDAQVGKRTLVVRIGVRPTVWVYGGLVLLAHAWLAASAWLLIAPVPSLWGELSLPLSLAAWAVLWRRSEQIQRLKPALALTVVATLLHGAGMAWGFAQLARLH